MKQLLSVFLLAISTVLSGCQILGPDDPREEGVSAHRAAWAEWSNGTYSFAVFRGCFCAWGGQMWIQVVDDEIVAAFITERNEPVPSEHLVDLHTIEDIFDMVERAEREAAELEVEWANEGYPSRVFIDWIKEAVDDEIRLEISGVVPGIHPID